jgi:hypothetical protein
VKRLSIVQSSYLPWLGYFDLIRRSDEFVFLDDVQYTKRDWRNRNYFKFQSGVGRLTVPVERGSRGLPIEDVQIAGVDWAARHWRSLSQSYAKAAYFKSFKDYVEPIFLNPPVMLSVLNQTLTRAVCSALSIKTVLSKSTDYGRFKGKNDRLISLCVAAGATHYLSGPKAQAYMDEAAFLKAGVTVEYMEYNYPTYRQLHGAFVPNLSILDALFNEGPNTLSLMAGEELRNCA